MLLCGWKCKMLERLPSRLQNNISPEPNSGCWLWLACDAQGYGRTFLDGRIYQAHRLVYETLVGTIPAGLVTDHICRVRCCVNPAHIELVTHKVNILRGTGVSAINATKTLCPLGHPLSGSNLVIEKDGRKCRVCKNNMMMLNYGIRKCKSRAGSRWMEAQEPPDAA
jgi:hypothetical protein